MRKTLTKLLSVLLIGVMVAVGAMAQKARKAVAPSSKRVEMTARASSEKKSPKGKKARVRLPQKRTAKANGLRKARKHIAPTGSLRAPLRSEGEAPTIHASMIYTISDASELGVYTVKAAADPDFQFLFEDFGASGGGVINDGVYYQITYESSWLGLYVMCAGFDLSTGEMVYAEEAGLEEVTSSGLAYDPLTGRNYGFFYIDDLSGFNFGYIDFDGTPTVNPIGFTPYYYSAISISSRGDIYAIRNNYADDMETVLSTTFCKIDRNTGEATEVATTGLVSQYLSSAVIDTGTDRMYWSISTDYISGMAEVNTTTGQATMISYYDNEEELVGLAIAPPPASDGAPGECVNPAITFLNGGFSGVCRVTAPTSLFDGSAGSGNLSIVVSVNGAEIASADNVAWGADVEIPIDMSALGAGLYNFDVYAVNGAGEGPKAHVKNIFVGADTPAATTATLRYVNGNMELTWLPVDSSVNGGYVDYGNISYKVVRADGSVAADGLTVCAFTEAVAEPTSITAYSYDVYAISGDLVSAPARSNVVMLGFVVPPYTSDFWSNDLDGFTVVDADGDGKTWQVYTSYARCVYNDDNSKNDWLMSPPLKLEGGKSYLVSFSTWSESKNYPEAIEVMWGDNNTAAAMTHTLLPLTNVGDYDSYSKLDVARYFTPETDGVYYIGWHAVSDKDMYYLNLSDFTIESGVASGAPAAVENLEAIADANGAKAANVSFDAPSVTLSGNLLTSISKIEVERDGTVVHTFNAPAPGAALSFIDTLDKEGEVSYKVTAYNESGAGAPATASLYVGVYLPLPPVKLDVAHAAADTDVILSWTPVTHDVNGVAIEPGRVVYDLYSLDGYTRRAIASGLSSTSYTATVIQAGSQDFFQFLVFARTDAGEGEGQISDMIAVGTPFNGLHESFSDQYFTGNYIWGIMDIEGTVEWNMFGEDSGIPSQDGDNGFVAMQGQYLYDSGILFSGLISLESMVNPTLSFYVYGFEGDAGMSTNEVAVDILPLGESEWQQVYSATVEEICPEEGWYKVKVPLQAYAGKVIQFGIRPTVMKYAYSFFDNFTVAPGLENDLVITQIQAPSKVACGADYTVDVTVANEGGKSADAYSVELYCNGSLLETSELFALAPDAHTNVQFDLAMLPVQTETLSYFARVVYATDQNLTNNQSATVKVTPVISNLPAPSALAGVSEENSVALTWAAPNLSGAAAAPVTFDFEDGYSFADTYGDWIFYDGDKGEVGGFQSINLPGIEIGESLGSFWVWDNDAVNVNETFDAHSGTHYLFALFNYDDSKVNDWAISPRLSGEAQTVSFYAKSYSGDYPEQIEVYYSTGSTNVADFVKVTGVANTAPSVVPDEWTLYEIEVPAGAERFAIRNCAEGAFMLMVDDVTFVPAPVAAEGDLLGYDVWRDGVKLNIQPVKECKYVDTNVVDQTQYSYVVLAVYKSGVSAPSNVADVLFLAQGIDALYAAASVTTELGTIIVRGAEGADLTIVAADGKQVFSGVAETETRVAVPAGIYLLRLNATTLKLIVK